MIATMDQKPATPGAQRAAATAAARYLIYRLNGRPVFAAPDGSRALRLAALSRYQPFTPKRAAYRRLMRWSMLLGVDRLLGAKAGSPLDPSPGLDFEKWLARVRQELNEPNATAAVFWPPQRDRGRIYVHLFNPRLEPVGFAKISFDTDNDARLAHEARTLDALSVMRLRHCRVPVVRGRGQVGGHESVVLEPLPADAQPLPRDLASYPREAAEEFAGPARGVPGEAIGRVSWWPSFDSRCDDGCRAFADEVRRVVAAQGMRVRRQHGDFGPANLVRSAGQLWIYDWEECCEDAPALADLLSYDLAINSGAATADPLRWLAGFEDRCRRNGGGRADVLPALAFRHSLGFADAGRVIRRWPGRQGTRS
jgi:hypothetical protein